MRQQSSPRLRLVTEQLLGAARAAPAAALLLLLALAACTGGGAGDLREWRWLVDTKRALDADRDRPPPAAATPAPAAAQPPAVAAEAVRRSLDVARRVADYRRRLARYVERHAPAAGEPPSPRERAALHMRSDEEVRTAREFVARAGDYRRAIEICTSALAVDPGYPPLESELAAAEAGRYVTAERFAKVKAGMTADQVLALLGPVNLHDRRDLPQRGLIAWFYPRDASGGAAAVWFKRVDGHPGAVFQTDFDAVDPHRDGAPPPEPPAAASPAGAPAG